LRTSNLTIGGSVKVFLRLFWGEIKIFGLETLSYEKLKKSAGRKVVIKIMEHCSGS